MPEPKRILFTGQSGIQGRDEHIIENFISSYPDIDKEHPPKYIKVEDFMFKIYCEAEGRKKWVDLLKEPVSVITDISRQAFETILASIKDEPGDVFLNCHICFYHLQTLEFIALPSLPHLMEFNPSKIITFIDDIYDIHLRLRQSKELLVGTKDEVDLMIFDLLRILDWRINEISMSRYLSTQLKIPNEHYVFSVKHTKKTLYDLIYRNDEKPTLYFSHPISEPRRLIEADQKDLAYPIIQEISEFSEYLSNNFVCFLPTTIDELRIKFSTDADEKKHFEYALKERWETETYEKANPHILYTLPVNALGRIPFGDEAPANSTVAYLLDVLFRAIDRQVSIRDKKLVEQCKVLFIYRPGFIANLSRGVRYELEYYELLNKRVHNKSDCIIYYPLNDQDSLKIKVAQEEINKSVDKDSILFDQEDINAIIEAWEEQERLGDVLEEVLEKHNKYAIVETGTLRQDRYAESQNLFLEIASRIKQQVHKAVEFYRSKCDVFIETNGLKPHELMREIELKKQAKCN